MTNLFNIGTILGVTLGIGATILFLFPILKKKGVDVEDVIKKVDTTLEAVESIVTVADKLLPGNSTIDVLKIVDKYARTGVHEAEQLCIASKLGKNDRNAKAKDTIYCILKLLKIEHDEDIDKIIDATIEAETLTLGHKDLTEVEKQAQLQNVQAQANQLQQENAQLKQTISNVQNTVQATQTVVQ